MYYDINIDTVIRALEAIATKLFKWFSNNYMKANIAKSHLLLSTNGVVWSGSKWYPNY